MKTYLQFIGFAALAAMVACGDDTSTGGGGSGPGGSDTGGGGSDTGGGGSNTGGGGMASGGGGSGGGGGIPSPPEPLAQIDRMGRPAINTALTDTFVVGDPMTGAITAVSSDPVRNASEDAYNAEGDENEWDNSIGTFAANLAILDALDTGVNGLSSADACGNQPGASMDDTSTAARYGLIATVLSDDRLWVNTQGMNCGANDPGFGSGYLAVEFNALGVANTGCGGRRPVDDTIDVTYGVVSGAVGMFGDGVTEPSASPPEVFPYLAPPH